MKLSAILPYTTTMKRELRVSSFALLCTIALFIPLIFSPFSTLNIGTTSSEGLLPPSAKTPASAAPAFDYRNFSAAGFTIVPVLNPPGNISKSQIVVTIVFNPSRDITPYLDSVQNPSSPGYRHFYTPGALADMFGISPALYQQIASYFVSNGLKVLESPARLSMTLVGNITSVGVAFSTRISPFMEIYNSSGTWIPSFGNYSGIQGNVSALHFFANTQPAFLPNWIESNIAGIVGLNTLQTIPALSLPQAWFPGMKFNNILPYSANNLHFENASTVMYYLNSSFGYLNGSEAASLGLGNRNYQLLFPSSMPGMIGARNLWNGTASVNGKPDTGQNVTVALIEVGLIPENLLTQFSSIEFHNSSQLPSRFTSIPLLGATIADANNSGWMPETALDIEYLSTMAPAAHIDLVAVPSPTFADLDYAYSYIAQYLTTFSNATTSVSITSNSYGAPESDVILEASPMYLEAENLLLSELALEGVTNFFASGDSGSGSTAAGAGIPAVATGSTSVGGGQLTAVEHGVAFPSTNITFNITVNTYTGKENLTVFIGNATGYSSFAYWYEFNGFNAIAGGFGISAELAQPWWQNALDAYAAGARMDPVISGVAAFNMTFYLYGWYPFYGGTSFATPITAGEWALIEEQVNVMTGKQSMGDINALLYDMHNLYLYEHTPAPFVSMTGNAAGIDVSAANYYSWNLYNLSVNIPPDPMLPTWYPSLYNPVDNGWNFLQGLGMPDPVAVLLLLFGEKNVNWTGILNMKASIVLASSDSGITSLTGYSNYLLRLNTSLPNSTSFTVVAVSDIPGDGVPSSGAIVHFAVRAGGTFNYTPDYYNWSVYVNNSEYGYFAVLSGQTLVSFQFFAVAPPNLSGNLTLGMDDGYGNMHYNAVNVPMFSLTSAGSLNTVVRATVMLNGVPVTNALMKEVAVSVNYSLADNALPPSYYAPGQLVSTFLTDQRGEALVWSDALIAENNGPLPTQVFKVYASFRGLTSNTLTVYVEPQAGSFLLDSVVSSQHELNGILVFNDLKFVSFINISCPQTGTFDNVTYGNTSTTSNGQVDFSLGTVQPNAPYVNLTVTAVGSNRLGNGFSVNMLPGRIVYVSEQSPITWFYASRVINRYAGIPIVSLDDGNRTQAGGFLEINYTTEWAPSGSKASIFLVSPNQTVALYSGASLNGSYLLNTSRYPDGLYEVLFNVSSAAGKSASTYLTVFFDNSLVYLTVEIATFSGLETNISALQSGISHLLYTLDSPNISHSVLQDEFDALYASFNQTLLKISLFIDKYGRASPYSSTLLSQQATLNQTMLSLRSEIYNQTEPVIKTGEGVPPLLYVFIILGLTALSITVSLLWVLEKKKNK
ncbi:MAG: protease pro-enzyme activation domain-containing protein [Methanomassiliicoccales archaeon]